MPGLYLASLPGQKISMRETIYSTKSTRSSPVVRLTLLASLRPCRVAAKNASILRQLFEAGAFMSSQVGPVGTVSTHCRKYSMSKTLAVTHMSNNPVVPPRRTGTDAARSTSPAP